MGLPEVRGVRSAGTGDPRIEDAAGSSGVAVPLTARPTSGEPRPPNSRGLPATSIGWGWASALVLAVLLPLLQPILAQPLHLAVQPHPTLGAILESEQPLTVRQPAGAWVLALCVVWFALAYLSRTRVPWWEGALIAAGALFALLRLGNVPVFAAMAAIPLARRFALSPVPRPGLVAALGALLAGLGLLAAARGLPVAAPPAAIAPLRPSSGAVFTSRAWADSLKSQLASDRQVLGAGDPWDMPVEFWTDYQRVSLGHVTWQEILRRWNVSALVLDASGSQRRAADLVRRPGSGWRVVLDDGVALAAIRDSG
ncbi:MAG: hypothetical protein HYX52_03180 [Chloroflexi bacterium]|nr:hypothetical protein [Chloroflexota bacterium]